MYYRYEIVDGNKRQGFLTGIDDYFNTDEIFEYIWIFEAKLTAPDIDMNNTRSYFTDKGNRKFRKTISKLKKNLEGKGLTLECEKVEALSNIAYKDINQVIIRIG